MFFFHIPLHTKLMGREYTSNLMCEAEAEKNQRKHECFVWRIGKFIQGA
jgi:hypothetical protein